MTQDTLFDWDEPKKLTTEPKDEAKGPKVTRARVKSKCERCQELVHPGGVLRAPALVAHVIKYADGRVLRYCYEHAYQELGRG